MMLTKPNIIFDFDGTIADIIIDWDKWGDEIENILREYEPDYKINWNSSEYHDIQNVFIEKYGDEVRNKLLKFCQDYEKEHTKEIIPIESVLNLIMTIKGSKLYVWSSNTENLLRQSLLKLGILYKFSRIVSRDDVYFIKPRTDGFELIKNNAADISISDYMFIGNSEADELAAQKLDMEYVDVKTLK